MFGIVGVTDKCLEVLSKFCASTITTLDVNGCIGIKVSEFDLSKVYFFTVLPLSKLQNLVIHQITKNWGFKNWECSIYMSLKTPISIMTRMAQPFNRLKPYSFNPTNGSLKP